nr:hypothetical protein CFP56_58668 [Quercus suber]
MTLHYLNDRTPNSKIFLSYMIELARLSGSCFCKFHNRWPLWNLKNLKVADNDSNKAVPLHTLIKLSMHKRASKRRCDIPSIPTVELES